MLTAIALKNYRTLRDTVAPLGQLTLVTGANGSGKSNLYRALRLLADSAQSRVVPSLAREGGLESVLWAGPETIARSVRDGEHPVEGTRRKEPVNLGLGFASNEFSYLIDLGIPIPYSPANSDQSVYGMFDADPEIKQERIWHGPLRRPSTELVQRLGAHVKAREAGGTWSTVTMGLNPFDSLMTQLASVQAAPEVFTLRESIRNWRFYDHFRTDAEAPARLPQIGTRTPVLASDGADVAAALQTIRDMGDIRALNRTVADAFPGARIEVSSNAGRFEISMRQHGLLRSLGGAELSDGTLRYLLWTAALLTPRPPALMVLNEPETSLHPGLHAPLARLILHASQSAQTIVVSHAPALIDTLVQGGCSHLALEKSLGETAIGGQTVLNRPAWEWPKR